MHTPVIPPDTMDRTARYEAVWPGLRDLVVGERDAIAAMANIAAALHATLGMHWTGFYRVQGEELVLGPFQGPVACTRIPFGKGVCGTAWKEGRTLVVPDVDRFPGHIACSALSRSEIVVPVRDAEGRIAAVLDIDSAAPDDFSDTDARYLEQVCKLLEPLL